MSMLTGYVVKLTPDTPNSDGQFVPFAAMPAFIDYLAGRVGVSSFVRSMRPGKVRVYIAADRNSPWRRETGRRGFLVEQDTRPGVKLPLSQVCRDCFEDASDDQRGCGTDHYAPGGDGYAITVPSA